MENLYRTIVTPLMPIGILCDLNRTSGSVRFVISIPDDPTEIKITSTYQRGMVGLSSLNRTGSRLGYFLQRIKILKKEKTYDSRLETIVKEYTNEIKTSGLHHPVNMSFRIAVLDRLMQLQGWEKGASFLTLQDPVKQE